MRRYSFDTSSFLNGRRDLLPPEVFPSLWTRIEMLISDGVIIAVDEVRNELGRRDDAIKTWSAEQTGLFVELAEDVQEATRRVLAVHPKLTGKGVSRNTADPFVIGLALARDYTVVTEETLSPSMDKPRIPNVCNALGIPCLNLVGFIRAQGWKF